MMRHPTIVTAEFDTDASGSVEIVIPVQNEGVIIRSIRVIPDVVGTSGTEFDAWLSPEQGVAKYDPSVKWLEEARGVTAGTPSSPGRDPAEWAVWNDSSESIWAYPSAQTSPASSAYPNALYVTVDFDAGVGHTGIIELCYETVLMSKRTF